MNLAVNNYRFFGCLRFLLAVLVIVSHTHVLGSHSFSKVVASYGLGNISVMVFFVLSGFIIAEANETFYKNKTVRFLINRGLRIYPPYYAALTLSILIHVWAYHHIGLRFYDYESIPPGLFSAPNLIYNYAHVIPLRGIYAPLWGAKLDYLFVRYIWAVVVELHFYLIAGLLFYLSAKMSKRHIFGVSFAVFSLMYVVSFYSQFPYDGLIKFFPYFSFGMCSYYTVTAGTIKPGRIFCLTISLVFMIHHFIGYVSIDKYTPVMTTTLMMVFLSILVFPLYSFRGSKTYILLDKFFGDLSYPIYLNHYVISILFLVLFYQSHNMLIFVLCLLSCILFSFFVSLLTEPLTKKLRDRIRGERLYK
jgi:peptidoglycan/LPS O-acetylase OafA/YrhL